MSTFDPTAFLNATFEGANDTTIIPAPEGEWLAVADKVEVKQWSKKDGSASGLKLAVLWDIQDDAAKQIAGRDKVIVGQDIMLDLTDSGGLDMGKGKNVRLGKLREALRLNDPSEPFSFSMMQGRMGKVAVKHDVDGDTIYARVNAVAAA
jgi:hypothetical protein